MATDVEIRRAAADADCDNCGDGTGWELHDTFGWVGCADCNDDLEKPKPTWKAIKPSLN